MTNLTERIEAYVAELNARHASRFFHYTKGTKYHRVDWRWCTPDRKEAMGTECVFCFIDADGNIYKPAGWTKVADGVRATLDSPVYSDDGVYKKI